MQYSFFEIVKNKKVVFTLLLILVLIPSYFIHSRSYPDWGDDFAQYVYQAQQINNPSEVYKKVLNTAEYSSAKRGVFFSILLSIIEPTTDIQTYVDAVSVFYILAAVCLFLFLINYFSLAISFITTLSVFYNFLFLRLKSEIVTEFLFIALFYFILYVFFSKHKWKTYIIPILLGLLVSVRFVGLSLVFSYLMIILTSKEKMSFQKIKELVLCLFISAFILAFFNFFVLAQVSNQEVGFYGSFVANTYTFDVFISNAEIYSKYMMFFFEQEIPFWINKVIAFFCIVFFGIGFVISVKNKRDIVFYSFVFYGLFLCVYPYNGDTIRFLIPIVPLFFYYIITGIYMLFNLIAIPKKEVIIGAAFLIILLSNSKTVWLAINSQNNNIGPFENSVLHDFKEVEKNVKPYESIAFAKPFLINLLCDRNSYYINKTNLNTVLLQSNYYLAAKPSVQELYDNKNTVKLLQADTISLNHFYLIKLR